MTDDAAGGARGARETILRASQPLLAAVERRVAAASGTSWPSEPAAMFIVGAPRSGTTLLYQLLTARYRTSYPTRFRAALFAAPVTAALLEKRLLKRWMRRPMSFESNLGEVEGWGSPHESARFWYRWFPRDEAHPGPDALPAEARDEIRLAIAGQVAVDGGPFVAKNVFNSLRTRILANALPGAVFVVSQRDPVDTAQSILAARQRAGGSWFSVRPPGAEDVGDMAVATQAAWQVWSVMRHLQADAAAIGADRYLAVDHAELCRNTRSVLDRLASRTREQGLELVEVATVPPSFPLSTGQRVSDEELGQIEDFFHEHPVPRVGLQI